MAKGNMLQGMARGKVGDVVFSRLNGEQIARVRNRNPKNPRTNAQLYQRAIMATVMSAYSAGKVIFDHSFQGYARGEANQRRFMSENAKRLRTTLAADLQETQLSDRSVFGFNAPSVNAPALANIKISEGTYPQLAFQSVNSGMVEPQEGETIAKYAARVSLVEGDLYTIVGLIVNTNQPLFVVRGEDNNENPRTQYATSFAYCRLQVKAGLSEDTTVITAATKLSAFFTLTDSFNCNPNIAEALMISENRLDWLGDNIGMGFYGGFIRSRINEDLRSTSYMQIGESVNAGDAPGITSTYILEAWKQGTESIGDSDLILEGGDQ